MENKVIFLTLFAMGMLTGLTLYGQCTPDPDCVDDDDKPGQFCPLDLPKGAINVLYDEIVTVIPPGTFEYAGFQVNIQYIEIDSVKNMPPGIEYYPNEDTLYPETAYCIQLTGTPTEIWKDTLQIHIAATVQFGQDLLRVPVVDDTSIVITIEEFVGMDPNQDAFFQVFQNVPNPFTDQTRLNCYVPFGDRIELNVYNMLGVLVHHEAEWVPPGEHSFRFRGRSLEPGTYFYRVANSIHSVSGKLVKTR